MRLDKLISHAEALSRKESGRVIRAGQVSVEGRVQNQPAFNVEEGATVSFQGREVLNPSQPVYLLMNKPSGVVCAKTDSHDPTVFDVLPDKFSKVKGLHPVGRLDKDTTGLLLLTTDGEWSHRVTSPKHEHPKTYRVSLKHAISNEMVNRLEKGVLLRDSDRITKPAEVRLTDDDHCIFLTITEGRYHQVKRMIAAVGNRVESLHRSSVGIVELPEVLLPGDVMALNAEWISAF